MTGAYWLATKRLALRRFSADDLDWFAALYSDDRFARYLGGTRDRIKAEALLRGRILEYYDAHPGLGIWVTTERATDAVVGFHLLNHIQGEPFIQVGYALRPEAWGRGFATEMALAILRYGFVDLGLPRIVAIASLPNAASHRVLAKIGLHRNGERAFAHPAYASQGPMAWFERDAAHWIAERGQERST
jgi:RimJ/RimL family protein N-acetyltransferase